MIKEVRPFLIYGLFYELNFIGFLKTFIYYGILINILL